MTKMIKVAIEQLDGVALDWAVAKREGALAPLGNVILIGKKLYIGIGDDINHDGIMVEYSPSTDHAQAGPIMDDNNISTVRCDDDYQRFAGKWAASIGAECYETSTDHQWHDPMIQLYIDSLIYGETRLIAAMRRYVVENRYRFVDIPADLV